MSEQEPSALRECPYCGERAIMTTLHTNNGRADNPLAYAYVVRCFVCEAQRLPAATPQIAVKEWNRRDGEAARVAEAVAAERERIVAALRENIARHKEAFDLHRESRPLLANEHNAARWGLKKAIAIALDEDAP
jgi:hypothetical protein